jgi:hypothetical protein
MIVRVARDVECVSICKCLFIAICRRVPDYHPVTLVDLPTAYFGLLQRGPHRMRDRSGPTQNLFHRMTHQGTILAQSPHLIRIANQLEWAAGDRVAGGIQTTNRPSPVTA